MKLTPAIIQDARTGEVLTLAYMNDEALAKTRATGGTWRWRRSRPPREASRGLLHRETIHRGTGTHREKDWRRSDGSRHRCIERNARTDDQRNRRPHFPRQRAVGGRRDRLGGGGRGVGTKIEVISPAEPGMSHLNGNRSAHQVGQP